MQILATGRWSCFLEEDKTLCVMAPPSRTGTNDSVGARRTWRPIECWTSLPPQASRVCAPPARRTSQSHPANQEWHHHLFHVPLCERSASVCVQLCRDGTLKTMASFESASWGSFSWEVLVYGFFRDLIGQWSLPPKSRRAMVPLPAKKWWLHH